MISSGLLQVKVNTLSMNDILLLNWRDLLSTICQYKQTNTKSATAPVFLPYRLYEQFFCREIIPTYIGMRCATDPGEQTIRFMISNLCL